MIAPLSIPGGWMWSSWQSGRGLPFNSFFFQTPAMNVAVDPLALEPDDLEQLHSLGGVQKILITNRDHVRESAALQAHFGAEIVDRAADGEELFPGAYAVRIEYGKSEEFAIHLPASQCAVAGDAMIGSPAGALTLLPDDKLADPRKLALHLRRLWAKELKMLLVCDGYPIFANADAVLGDLLWQRLGGELHRINVDELEYVYEREHHERYGVNDAEVGLNIGARRLGYRVSELPPGHAFCPMHWHVESEEFFYVLEGNPSIRTAAGTLRCRPGDFIAFPVGERGSHQLFNDAEAPARVLLVGGEPSFESCFYPDSRKVLVDARDGPRLIVRSEPQLPYWDGE